MQEHLNNTEQDAEPIWDAYVLTDRVVLVRRDEAETAVDASMPAQAEPVDFALVPFIMLASHGLVVLLLLLLVAYQALVPDVAQVYALTGKLPNIARVHSLPAVGISKSETVPASGRVHVPATQARGLVTFYNALTGQQVIDAGTLLIGADGEQVVTDQVAYVPGSNLPVMGSVTVRAHALNPGAQGNLRAGDISGPCCRAFIQAVNAQFSGGHGARDYATVAKSDITAAASALLAQEQQSVQGRLSALLAPGDALITPVRCTTHTASDKPAGAQAQQITVTVAQTCQPSAYNLSELERALAALIAGKTPVQARAILARQGIQDAGIRLSWLHDRLPIDINQIKIVVVFH